jgi:hypothetical protein
LAGETGAFAQGGVRRVAKHDEEWGMAKGLLRLPVDEPLWLLPKCGGRRRSLLWDQTGSVGRHAIHHRELQLHDRPAA